MISFIGKDGATRAAILRAGRMAGLNLSTLTHYMGSAALYGHVEPADCSPRNNRVKPQRHLKRLRLAWVSFLLRPPPRRRLRLSIFAGSLPGTLCLVYSAWVGYAPDWETKLPVHTQPDSFECGRF